MVDFDLALAEQPALVPIQHPADKPVLTLPPLKYGIGAVGHSFDH